MPETPVPPPLGAADRANFNTLLAAVAHDDLALVSAIRKVDRKPVGLVCAMARKGKWIIPMPLAVMIEGNPFEDFEDPTVTEPDSATPG
jgi:hypothetical protein